jgi:hypothetical protein
LHCFVLTLLRHIDFGHVFAVSRCRGVALRVLLQATLSDWLNQKIDPIYAFMIRKLTLEGSQPHVIKMNCLKPLFKEACAAVKAGAAAVSQEAAASRHALEAEWAASVHSLNSFPFTRGTPTFHHIP